MKKAVIILLLCAAFVLTACDGFSQSGQNDSTSGSTDAITSTGAATSAEQAEDTDNSDTTGSTNTAGSTTSSEGAYNESPHVTPAFKFKSIKQLHEFCTVATSSQEEYDKYVADYGVNRVPEYILLEDAREIAMDIPKALLFNEDTATAFGATYFVDSNVLDIGYTINGVRYLITHYKTLSYTDIQPEGELVMSQIPVGDTAVDLYWVSNGLTGFIPEGNNRLTRIRIYNPANHDAPPSQEDLALDKFIWVEPEDFDLYIDTTANINSSQPTYRETDAETVAESIENVSTETTNESTEPLDTILYDTDSETSVLLTEEPVTEYN